MNVAFFIFVLGSLIFLTIKNPEIIIPTMIEGGSNAITFCIKLVAIYAIWLSVLKIMDECKISYYLAKAFKPITKRLFKGESDKTYEYISMNLATNMIGLGGAATPLGIKATEGMYKGERATKNMIMFVVINSTSIQLLPTTIISLRAANGSIKSSDIILPCLIASIITSLVGIILVNIFYKDKENKLRKE